MFQLKNNYNGWINYWKRLATDFAADPLLSKWVLYDLINEPDMRTIG